MGRLMGTPLSERLHLQLEADNGGGMEEGQVPGTEEPLEGAEVPDDPGQAGEEGGEQSGEQEPFFSYAFEDGEEKRFNDPDELKKFVRDGVLRHSDYTRKTQSVAEERKQLEEDRKRYDAEYSQMLQTKQEHDKIQQYLNSLPPQVYQQLKQQVAHAKGGQQNSGDPRVDKLMKEFEAEKKSREEREQAETERQQRDAAFSQLEKDYPDFKRDEVQKMAKELEEAPPGGQMRAMMELLYFASLGKGNPAKMEQRIASNLQKKNNLRTPVNGGGKPPANSGSRKFSTFEEAAEQARADILKE